MPKVFELYGTPEDISDLLGRAGGLESFRFAWLRQHDANDVAFAERASDLPLPLPSEFCLCRETTRLTPRPVMGKEGVQRFVLTPRDVSDGTWMQIGTTDDIARMVCMSRMFVIRDDPTYQDLFKAFGRMIQKIGFAGYCMGKRSPATFVLPKAAELLKLGWRLNQHTKMPVFNDITLG